MVQTSPGRPTTRLTAVERWTGWVAPVLAGVVATVVLVAQWKGADWPAQVFRIEMFRRDGLTIWNNHWYGGHHSIGYSLLMPALGATFGGGRVAVVAAVVATWALQEVLRRIRPNRTAAIVAASLFAVSLGANLAVGRLPFQLGLALGLLALVCWTRGQMACALTLAVLSGLASPVAGLFLGVVAGGVALVHWRAPVDLLRFGDVRGRGPAIALAAMGPVIVIALVFPSGGSFPFAFGGLVLSLLSIGAVGALSTAEDRELRGVLGVAAVATVAAFVIPTPLGGNAVRLAMFFALPVIVVLVWDRRRWVVPIASVVLLGWAWSAATDAVVRASDDPTLDAAYFAPMIDAIRAEAGEPVRVEIPFTLRHWEAAHVAPVLPLARGWERQLDRDVNPVFYGEDDPTALELHVWLRENAVRYVALPDAELDPSAEAEAALLEAGQPYLRPVWENANWRVWEVLNSDTLVTGDAHIVEMGADRIVIDVEEAGEVVVRVRFSPHWIVEGETCVREDPEAGWTVLVVPEPGRQELRISPAALAGVSDATADACDDDAGDDDEDSDDGGGRDRDQG